MTENGVIIGSLVADLLRGSTGVACGRAIARGVGCARSAELGLTVRGGFVSKRTSSTTTTAVTTSAAMLLRIRTRTAR